MERDAFEINGPPRETGAPAIHGNSTGNETSVEAIQKSELLEPLINLVPIPVEYEQLSLSRNQALQNLRHGSDIGYTITYLEQLKQSTSDFESSYEFDHSWRQEDVDLILDKLESVERNTHPEDDEDSPEYDLEGQIPWFLTTSQGKAGEKRLGVSELVVRWMSSRIDTKRGIDPQFQDALVNWTQHIQMVPLETTLSLLRKAKNHPGSLSNYLHREILAGLSFYSNNGYYTDKFKRIATNTKSSFEEVTAAINNLIFFRQVGDEAGLREGGAFATVALKEIYEKRPEYFVRLLIKKELAMPLEHVAISTKKTYLEREGYDTSGYSDDAIESRFFAFIQENYAFCKWAEQQDSSQIISEDGYKAYAFGTYDRNKDFLKRRSVRSKQSALENSTFSRVSDNFGVRYISNDSIQIFRLDQNFEAEREGRRQKYGQVDEENFHFNTTKIERHFNNGKFLQGLCYLRGLGLLSPERNGLILSQLDFSIPPELTDENKFSERERYISEHPAEIEALLAHLNKPGVVANIVAALRTTEQEMIEEAEQRYHGYRSLNTDRIDFYLSFYDQPPERTTPPHHTFYYYAYLRKFLPTALVKEFETKYKIHIPPKIEGIETYDDFLDITPSTLAQTFDVLDREGIQWLREKLVGLGDSIKETLPKAEPVDIQEFFLESGIPEENLSDEFIAQYRSLLHPNIRAEIETRIGFSIADIDVPAQVAFLEFLSKSDEATFGNFCEFLKPYSKKDRVAICSAYLAFQDKPDFSYIVERVCEHEGIGLPLIRHVYELIGTAEKIKQFLNAEYITGFDRNIIAKVHHTLIDKAYNILLKYNTAVADLETIQELDYGGQQLVQYATDLGADFNMISVTADSSGERYERERTRVAQRITQECAEVNISQTLLLNTFKTLKEAGITVSIEDFRDSEFVPVTGREIPQTEVARMRTLYEGSMKGYPEETSTRLLSEFDTRLLDEQSAFRLFRYKGEVAGFLCFSEEKPGQKYVSAVTMDPRFQKAYIGETMIDQAFSEEAKESALGADCVARKSVSARYIENGFIGVKSWDDQGDLIMDIIRDDRRNEHYFSSKKLSQEEITRLAPLGRYGEAHIITVADPKEHAFSLCNEGFVLTRYFKDPKNKKWYLVYEPDPRIAKKTSKNPETTDGNNMAEA